MIPLYLKVLDFVSGQMSRLIEDNFVEILHVLIPKVLLNKVSCSSKVPNFKLVHLISERFWVPHVIFAHEVKFNTFLILLQEDINTLSDVVG